MGKGAKGTTVPDPASDRTLDEDLIEATIRRVAEARAAREGAVAEATTVQFPGLRGVLPGFGLQDPNDWGLGFEIRGTKRPHWTGSGNSPATVGHFGRSGTFLWVDPVAGLAVACLTDRPFGAWAGEAWPVISDAILAAWRALPARNHAGNR